MGEPAAKNIFKLLTKKFLLVSSRGEDEIVHIILISLLDCLQFFKHNVMVKSPCSKNQEDSISPKKWFMFARCIQPTMIGSCKLKQEVMI